MTQEIEEQYDTNYVICPYCLDMVEAPNGDDSWTYEEGTHIVECYACGKKYKVEVYNRGFYYTTNAIEEVE